MLFEICKYTHIWIDAEITLHIRSNMHKWEIIYA